MVLTCCVVGCSNHGGRNRGVSFYHIPAVLEHQGEKKHLSSLLNGVKNGLQELTEKTGFPLECVLIISCQVCFNSYPIMINDLLSSVIPIFTFIFALNTGKPATLQDCNNLDWVPSLKMEYDVPVLKETIECYSCLQARKRRRHDIDTAESLLLLAGCESGISVGIYRKLLKSSLLDVKL